MGNSSVSLCHFRHEMCEHLPLCWTCPDDPRQQAWRRKGTEVTSGVRRWRCVVGLCVLQRDESWEAVPVGKEFENYSQMSKFHWSAGTKVIGANGEWKWCKTAQKWNLLSNSKKIKTARWTDKWHYEKRIQKKWTQANFISLKIYCQCFHLQNK